MKIETAFNFGDIVREKRTGFEGTVVAIYLYEYGCTRVEVQPPLDKDGKWQNSGTFDDGQLEIVTKTSKIKKLDKNGGPALYSDSGR